MDKNVIKGTELGGFKLFNELHEFNQNLMSEIALLRYQKYHYENEKGESK